MNGGTEYSPADHPASDQPIVPPSAGRRPEPMYDPRDRHRPHPGTAWYRTDEDRYKSVRRRANPWYMRLARGLVGIGLLAVVGLGLYFGARVVRDYLERDRLPPVAAEIPTIRGTSFQVTAGEPSPAVDGTLTLDAQTRAFEFVGRFGGIQSGLQIVSPDAATVYLRQGSGAWRLAGPNDAVADDVREVVSFLADDGTADAVITSELRRGLAELIDRTEEGIGDDRRIRYELTIDTERLSVDFPIQWQNFQDHAIPGAVVATELPVTIWLDVDDVLVRVSAPSSNWSWERLAYTTQPFTPADPTATAGATVSQVACTSPDGAVFWQTPLPTCDDALSTARQLAVTAGVVAAVDDPGADQATAELCRAMENGAGPVAETPARQALAGALVAGGVCLGDPAIFQPG